MALSKRKRFEVFKRDGFHCQYCGRTPPGVVLHVDHIIPQSADGSDEMENLVTSCCDCNLGKSDVPLGQVPSPLIDKMEVLEEKRAQLKAYNRLVKRLKRQENEQVEIIADAFTDGFPGYQLSERFKRVSVKKFVSSLPTEKVEEFMATACSRFADDRDRAIRYFCGMCWKRIKGEIVDG